MKKNLIRIAAALLVLLVVGGLAFAFYLDTIIKHGVEGFGPKVTQTPITLNGVSLSLLGGSAELKGFVLGNPAGYKTTHAMDVDRVSVSLSPGSILSDKVVVRSVVIEGAKLSVEGSPTDNNFTKIQSNVEAFVGGGAKTQAGPGKKLQVDELVMKDCKLDLTLGLLGGKTVTMPMPDIRLTQLGQGPEGITPADLVDKILGAVTGNIGPVAAQAMKNLGGAVTDTAKDLGKGATEGVDKATKGIKNLFKKKE